MIMMKPAAVRLQTIEMGEFKEGELDELFTSKQALLSQINPPRLHGDSIRAKNPAAYPPPTSVYLIYFTMEADGTPHAVQVFDPVATDRVASENALYALAKSGNPGPALVGEDFEDLVWRSPTYISIVLDVDDHEFFWFDPEGYDPIMFIDTKEKIVNGTLQNFNYAMNKSFYDAERATLHDPVSGKERPVLRFANYFRDGNGNAVPPGARVSFCMSIQLLARYRGKKVWKHIIDPDSENQGPDGGPIT